jgi:hypothetical protein
MYRDYRSEEGGALETIPGFRCIKKLDGRINGLFRLDTANGTSYIVAHAGTKLYLCREDQRDDGAWAEVGGSLADNPSTAFVYNGVMYVLDGHLYQKLKEKDGCYELVSVMSDTYVPRTWYMGEQYEQRNMLTDRYNVADLGSSGVAAAQADRAEYGADITFYQGGDSFVFSHFNETKAYSNKGVKMVVFGHDALNNKHVTTGNMTAETDTSIESVAILAKDADIACKTGFTEYGALKRFYFVTDGVHKIVLPESGNLEMKKGGKLYFPCAMNGLDLVFSCAPAVSGSQRACSWLPPNVVVRAGETTQTGDAFLIRTAASDAETGGFVSTNIKVNGTMPTSPDPTKIYVHNGDDGCIAVTAGAGVSPGRYWLQSYVYNEKSQLRYRFYRIEVTKADATDVPVAVQDVFEYTAAPRVFHLPEKTKSVYSVKDDDGEVGFGCIYDDEGNVTAVGAMVRPGDNEVTIDALASDYHVRAIGTNSTYLGANPEYKGTSEEAINGCTLCAIYDDRVFLAGNPALPNTVFYSARNDVGVNDPSYFGVLNYFNDGVGGERVTALFPFSDTLCVAKKDNVFYHQGSDGTDYVTRVYPSVRGNAGLGSLGACCSFLDDPVMLTKEGVYGVNKETLTLERTLGRRSSTIDARLLREQNLDEARMVEWEGYLCLFVGGHVYMADSRAAYEDATGGMQYEWFYLCDVGVWRDESGLTTPVYAADTGELPIAGEKVTQDGTEYALTETHEEILFTDAYSAIVDGQSILYAIKDGKAYAVYETDELAKEGTFHPAVCPMVVGDRLYFGADTGEVFVFNNDKRGVSVNGDEVEQSELHYSFYSFAGHSIDSGFLTRYDDCGIPHLCKSTSSRSLVLRVKLMSAALFTIGVSTERAEDRRVDEISASRFSFAGTDFSSLSFMVHTNATIVAGERERKWVAKQYLLRDGGFCRPFGVYSMTYRYRIAGRIR